MGIFIIYAIIVVISMIIVGATLLLIDHILETRRAEKIAGIADYLIPRAFDNAKQMSVEMIHEINTELYKQFGLEKEEP